MSPSLLHADNRRTTARVVLFMVVAVITTLVLFSGGPNGPISFAQQQTTQPAGSPPCRGAQIEFLNPSGAAGTGPGREVSSKPEAQGSASQNGYHLVAWVSGMPDNASVQFKYDEPGDNPETNIGTASLVGSDTFELYWDTKNPDVEFESGTGDSPGPTTMPIRAILYANSTVECDRDEEEIVMNDEDPGTPPDPQDEARGETVEITYPTNAGAWAVHNGVGFIEGRFSAGTTFVYASYTISNRGTEPTWKACGNESASAAADGVKCTLAEGDVPTRVTAVALSTNDTDPRAPSQTRPGFHDSGDAHRAAPYVQVPSAVSLTSNPANNQVAADSSGNFPCSPILTALVSDQFGRKVAGANVDVHAQGPTDNLFFDDDDETADDSSASQPPDKGGHATESGVDCEDTDGAIAFTATVQGDHDSAAVDTKHIESAPGTEDDGTFSFRLLNRTTTTGTTNLIVWADRDDNDQFCGTEPNAIYSLGWGVAPTGGAAPADPQACPAATTGSASPTTASPSPTPTTSSPTPSSSPSTASPTPTNTTPPPPIAYSSTTTIKRSGGAFTGKVRSDAANCRKGRKVVLKKQRSGRDKTLGSDRTDRRGAYKIVQRRANGTYYTVALTKRFTDRAGRAVTCAKDRSPNKRV